MKFLFSPNGRIGRLAWWGGEIIPFLILVVGFVIIGEVIGESFYTSPPAAQSISILVLLTFPVLSTWMNFCLTAKRFHDRDKSALWFLIVFVPFIGGIWQIVECGFLRGDGGVNGYGPPGGGGGYSGALDDEIEALRRQSREAAGSFEPPSAGTAQAATVTRAARGRTGLPSAGAKPAFGRR